MLCCAIHIVIEAKYVVRRCAVYAICMYICAVLWYMMCYVVLMCFDVHVPCFSVCISDALCMCCWSLDVGRVDHVALLLTVTATDRL